MEKTDHVCVLVSLPMNLSASVDLALFDPIRGKIKYGARSRLVSDLLRGWLEKREKKSKLASHSNTTAEKETIS